jgi:glycosyltransferase involved in cell wall biosynthesis
MRTLVLMPSLNLPRRPDGTVAVTRKFVEGAEGFVESWDGPVRILAEDGLPEDGNLDEETLDPRELPFEIRHTDFMTDRLDDHVADAAVVLGAIGHRQNHLGGVFRGMGVPFVYAAEYSLQTRVQIIATETPRGPRRYYRYLWEAKQEHAQRRGIRRAHGLQCNGTPTFDAYRALSPAPMVYFDTRVNEDALVDDATLDARLATLDESRPLRLAFSGRLRAMKGVQHLPELARALARRQVPFTLRIFGDGVLRSTLEDRIATYGLRDKVTLEGSVPFHEVLMPTVAREVDLFILPHVQGDPSCTYLETMSAGVPIAGFANEAWAGLSRRGLFGWTAPVGDVEALADTVVQADRDRGLLVRAARAARKFAKQHTFEATMRARVDHLRSVART